MSSETTFRAKAPELMARLIARFNFSVEDAAAIAGNGGHESGGFAKLQELKPTVKGSRGGYGWFQWTGPRRKAFEKFCAEKGVKPSSDKANMEFLILELITTESRAVPAVKAARTLADKVVAFEKNYERAGVKHYQSRLRWAKLALIAWQSRNGRTIDKTTKTKWAVAGGGGAVGGTVFATFGEAAASSLGYNFADMLSWQFLAVIAVITGVLAVAALAFMGHERRERLWTKMFGGWLA